jgi:poly(hydroxyalkanoate) depolymerase family esterase
MKHLRSALAILIVAAFVATTFVSTAQAASLVQVTNFGTNPTGLAMYLYVPANVQAKPAILLALHYCTGTGPAFYSGTQFASLADQYGFIIIYPSAPRSGQCWDVSSPQALVHNGSSDPVGLVSMITYVEQHNNGDPNRVYVTGASSGAMMTNVMLGDYPDVFKAGAAFMGVPDTCFSASAGDPTNPANQAGWNSSCANGTLIKTAQQWGDLARGAYPGYSGARPRMQVWHGTTDTTLNYNNFGEEIKQWTNVLGVSQTASFTDTPQSGWTRTRYGGTGVNAPVEAISISGVGHSLPLSGQALMVIKFFGLDGAAPATPTRTFTPPPGNTPTKTFTPVAATNTPVTGTLSINVGGSATGSFTADQYYSGGTAYTNTNTIDVSQVGSVPAAVFQSERYGAFSYTIPSRSGAQTVTLYFAETYLTAAGQRLFNVSINGATVLSSFDIYASAGGQNKAIAKTFNTTANSSGQVVIQLTTGTENPKINGITVASGTGPTNTPVPPTAGPTATKTNTPVGPTATKTNTPVGPTNTPVVPTNTPTVGSGTCSPVTATITAPFTKDGAGTFCWQASTLGAYLNSWNTTSVAVNGTNYTNIWVAVSSLPAKINGFWYISYTSSVSYGHFEAK